MITWEDVLALSPSTFASTVDAVRRHAVDAGNAMAADAWFDEVTADRARTYRAAHEAALLTRAQTNADASRVVRRSAGPVAVEYAREDALPQQGLARTVWGQLLLEMQRGSARIRIPGGV